MFAALCSVLVLAVSGCGTPLVESTVELESCDEISIAGQSSIVIVRAEPGLPSVARFKATRALHRDDYDTASGLALAPKEVAVEGEIACNAIRSIQLLGESHLAVGEGFTPEKVGVYGRAHFAQSQLETPALDLRAAGQAQVAIAGVDVDELSLMASGQGQVTLSGTASTARLSASGQARIDTEELRVQSLTVTALGQTEIAAWATAHLVKDIASTATLEVKGSPDVSDLAPTE